MAAGAKILSAHVGEIEDRHHVGRRRAVRQRPLDNTLKPNDRAPTLFRREGTERVELGNGFHQRRNDRPPLPVCIRPKECDWCGGAIRRPQSGSEGLLQSVDKRPGSGDGQLLPPTDTR